MLSLYNIAETRWDENKLNQYCSHLSLFQQQRLSFINDPRKKQQKITGLLLLKAAFHISGFDHTAVNLDDLVYTSAGKPVIDNQIHCSISHSEECTIITLSKNTVIGIDIEKIKLIRLNDFKEHFTRGEWLTIQSSPDVLNSFYKLWTRKEALLKALGTGFLNDLHQVEVLLEEIICQKTTFFFLTGLINSEYIVSLAHTKSNESKSLDPQFVSLSDLGGLT